MAGAAAQPPSEARVILDALAKAGMDRQAIARALGISAEAIRNIQRGTTPGVKQLPRLKTLYQSLSVQFPRQVPGHQAGEGADTGAQSGGNGDGAFTPGAPGISASALPVEADISAPAPDPEPAAPVGERVKGSIRDFLLGKNGASAVIAAAENKQSSKSAGLSSLEERQARLVEQVTPILALGVVILSDVLIGHPAYKPVAPTHGEADAIMRPIVRMAARQLEITGQLSENTVDILASFAALAVYTDRAWHTYKLIRDTEGSVPSDSPYPQHAAGGPVPAIRPGSGAAARAHDPALSASAGVSVRRPAGPATGADAGAQGGQRGAGHDERARQHNALLDSVLAADADGRRQLGVA